MRRPSGSPRTRKDIDRRWLTVPPIASAIYRYVSTLQPSDERLTLVTFIVHVYSPLWLHVKREHRLQDGPNNVSCLISWSRYLQSQWKIVIGSLEHYEAQGQDQTGDIRKFVLPTIIYNATDYYDMTNWFSPAIHVTQPPLVAKLSEDSLRDLVDHHSDTDFRHPSHTQAMIRVVFDMGVFIIFHWGGGGAQLLFPARWRHNMAPRGRMLSFSQQVCNLHASIAVRF